MKEPESSLFLSTTPPDNSGPVEEFLPDSKDWLPDISLNTLIKTIFLDIADSPDSENPDEYGGA